MAKFTVSADENHNPISSFNAALKSRIGHIGTSAEVVHPSRALAIAARNFDRSFNNFVSELEKSDFYTADKEGSTSGVLIAFEDMCYSATELFDVYLQVIPRSLNLKQAGGSKHIEQEYVKLVKKHRSIWALICNKIKHNHNQLVPVRQRSLKDGSTVRGFALFQPTQLAGLSVNRELHKDDERSRTFDMAAHQLLSDLMYCDRAAADAIRRLPESPGAPEQHIHDLRFDIGPALRKLSRREVMQGDGHPAMYDGFHLEERAIAFQRRRGVKMQGQLEISAIYIADGFTNSFDMI